MTLITCATRKAEEILVQQPVLNNCIEQPANRGHENAINFKRLSILGTEDIGTKISY